jgi:hypothetical protein
VFAFVISLLTAISFKSSTYPAVWSSRGFKYKSIMAEIMIEKSTGEADDPCGIAPSNISPFSIFPSKLKASNRSVESAFTHPMKYAGVLRNTMILITCARASIVEIRKLETSAHLLILID